MWRAPSCVSGLLSMTRMRRDVFCAIESLSTRHVPAARLLLLMSSSLFHAQSRRQTAPLPSVLRAGTEGPEYRTPAAP